MNAERLLGGIIRGALSEGGLGASGSRRRGKKRRRKNNLFGLSKMQIGMGVIATAVAAFDHFSKQKSSNVAPSGSSIPSQPVTENSPEHPLPPLPGQSDLPPLPDLSTPSPKASATPADLPPLPPIPTSVPDPGETAKIVIQAMISAASADGDIDDQEKTTILKKVEEAELTDEEHAFLKDELAHPKTVEEIAAGVTNSSMAQQVYIASLLAIEVDTEAERAHMSKLAILLGLDANVIALLHQATGDSLS